MTTALSIQNAEMSKGVKPSLRTRFFSKTKMLKAAKAVFPVAVLAAAFPEVAMATTTGRDSVSIMIHWQTGSMRL
ncbi:type IV conjugative transfer system pilin TraA [Klebsiella aerogenes]|uniref:type IV conjugative transfer system pilin TraA n=1 Tax=Klebsiella aerogenes TaxID=548 RepID=UPI001D0D8FC1|nr:type IV conjugative transfer system pilin TraA [Klebsiella aerogenes]